MPERRLLVTNSLGLHTRPSTRVAQIVSKSQSVVIFYKDDMQADARSVINLLLLAATHGESLRVVAQGPDAEAVLDALAVLEAEKFGEVGDLS